MFENPNLNWKGSVLRINWIARKSNVWVAVTTQLPVTHIQCALSLVTTEFEKSFICFCVFFDFREEPDQRSKTFSKSFFDYHSSSHGLIKLSLDHFSAENEWLPCWLVKKKNNNNNHAAKRTAVPCHEFRPRNRGRKKKWKQKGNNNRWLWQLYAATVRKSKYKLKTAGSSVNRSRLNCQKND